MGWRSVVIANPASLDFHQRALRVEQAGKVALVPLEDISVLVLDNPQIMLTAYLLSSLAEAQIAVITVNETHHPNGVLLPYLPHSRALKVMRAQLEQSIPTQKRAWQSIVRQKIANQAAVIARHRSDYDDDIRVLSAMSEAVRSGDMDNIEAQAAQRYFRALFGPNFNRGQSRFYNAALNYGYAVMRAAIARSLVSYGFLPAFGLHHRSEQNAFNLADDVIEPFRPLVDAHIFKAWPIEPQGDLAPTDKRNLVALLHEDIQITQQAKPNARCNVLAAVEANVVSLTQWLEHNDADALVMPVMQSEADEMSLAEDADG
jgi:CRISP-associated protein Cas1